MVRVVGVEELGAAFAEDLETVVEVRTGSEILGAEAGAGVVDFEQLDGLRGVVADGGLDVRGAAAGGRENDDARGKSANGTHEFKSIKSIGGAKGIDCASCRFRRREGIRRRGWALFQGCAR